MNVSRRKFIGASAAAVIAAGTVAKGKVFGANAKARVACCGINGRGGSHINAFSSDPRSEVAVLCDPDKNVLESRAKALKEATGMEPKTFTDVRDVLADDSIDIISIATPNHWHTLMAIWGIQAGKDVYVEKPLSHNIYEGRQLVAAMEKSDRIVQHGTQSRSDVRWMQYIQALQSGCIGEVYMARGLCYKNGNRGSIGFAEDATPPEYLDWNMWQGPAAEQAYNEKYHPYTWHWFWHYGNGEIGNQGVHQMDIGTWGMNKGLPVKVFSEGGRFTYKDQGQTPNTHVATFKYADGTMFVFEVRSRFTNDEGGVKVGNLFYGSDGYLSENLGFFDKEDKKMDVPMPEMTSEGAFGNFLTAVHARDKSLVHGNALQGHISCVHCHLANISYRLGRSLEFDPETERFKNDDEANAMLSREYRAGFEVPQLA
ncbi:MAG: dehydrogenase [Candidatus Hydrogenedentota bacterium]